MSNTEQGIRWTSRSIPSMETHWWISEEERQETLQALLSIFIDVFIDTENYDPANRSISGAVQEPECPETPLLDLLGRDAQAAIRVGASGWEVFYDEFRAAVAFMEADYKAWRAWAERRRGHIEELFDRLRDGGLSHTDTRIEKEKEYLRVLHEEWAVDTEQEQADGE